ncbi:hypothetical protein ACS0TY_021422 [Phlomoides rotata]
MSTNPVAIRVHIEQFYSQLFSAPAGPVDFGIMPDLIAPSVTAANYRERNAHGLKRILDSYASLSGQIFNPEKSKAYFGKHVSTQNKAYFRATLNIGSTALLFIYLGVLIFRGAPKTAHLRGTTDCIIAKFAGWKGSSLSLAGRACLVNSVIILSLVHSMMIYRWPRSLLNKINKAMRNFIWTGSTEKKGFCTMNWTKRLAWTILNSKDSSMLFIRARFFKGKLPRTKYINSSVWRGVHCHVCHILKDAH